MSLVIRGSVFTGGKLREAAVRIEDGVITDVGDGDLGPAAEVVDLAPGDILLPAAIDTMCALRDWNEALRDTVETATRAALAGGVTVVGDQPNTSPRLSSPELVAERSAFVAERSYVDFCLSAHPPADPGEIAAYRDAGAFCLQFWPWDMRPWNYPRDTDDSPEVFRRYAEAGVSGMLVADEHALRETPLRDEAEGYAMQGILRRLHPDFVARIMLTQPASAKAILAARERLPNALIQAAPHSLFISKEAGFRHIGIGATQIPPLRSDEDVAGMQALAEAGAIDILVSHHASHRFGDKYNAQPIEGEFAPKGGFSAIDFAYPLFLSRLGVERTCRAYCETPARYLGQTKGVIAKGYEADLVVMQTDSGAVDRGLHEHGGLTSGVWKVDPVTFQSLGKVTPFVGERLRYRVRRTYLRGDLAYDADTGVFRRGTIRQIR